MSRLFLFVIVWGGVVAARADAQWVYDNRASTVGESYARGMSDMVRSAGQANLQNSEAARNYEDARRMYLENRLQATDTYFQMRAMNRAFREAERGPRPTSEQMFRWAREAAPSRLSPSDLDPFSGSIDWPNALRSEPFAADRADVEAAFQRRAEQHGVLSPEEFQAARQSVTNMLGTLRGFVNSLPSGPYLEARNFLTSLEHELQFDPL